MNTYKCFYLGKQPLIEHAGTSLQAQEQAAKRFRATKRFRVHVVLMDKDGVSVPVATSAL